MTVPVAKQRKSNNNDDLDRSYVFDYQEDKRARAADEFDSTSFSPRKSAARSKMRHLEDRFGSSAPTRLSASTTTASPRSGPRRVQSQVSGWRPAIPFENNNSSDGSLEFADLENQRPTQRIPSKSSKNHMSLNGYLTSPSHNSKGRLTSKSSKASRGSYDSKNSDTKRKVQMRDTDRLIRPRGSGMERQDSGMMRAGHASSPAVLKRQNSLGNASSSWGNNSRGNGFVRTPSTKRGRSTERGGSGGKSVTSDAKSSTTRPPVTRQASNANRSRSMSADRSRPPQTTIPSKTKRSRSQSLDRSQRTFLSDLSKPTIVQQGDKTVVYMPVTQEQARRMPVGPQPPPKNGFLMPFLANGSFNPKNFARKIPPIEEKPPKSLVLIWVVVSAELGFDLATTIIAFLALVEDDTCCGEQINLGPIPMTVTTPFFLLVLAELGFLFRAMVLTMWPSIFTDELTERDMEIRAARGFWKAWLCCCLRWKAKLVLRVLGFLVLLNPFFGCIIAWMLLYQSNERECFIVLGLEGASIVLHFASVYLEGSCKTWKQFCCNCIPLIPFVISVSLILFYLKQGGVCYLVDQELFMFTGCEICADGYPPVDNKCLINGTNYTIGDNGKLFNFQGVTDLAQVGSILTQRVEQGEFCGNSEKEGPDISFCFYTYD